MSTHDPSLNMGALALALQILKEEKCYGNIPATIPKICEKLKALKYSDQMINDVVWRLENICGKSHGQSGKGWYF